MAKHRTHSVEFKQQVSQEYLAGETLHALAKRHGSGSGSRSFRRALSMKIWRRPIFSRIMRRALAPSSGWSANRLWSLSF